MPAVSIASPGYEWRRMASDPHGWALSADLCGGTAMMQAAGARWLDRLAREDDKQYRGRVRANFITHAYENAVNVTASRPFSRRVILKDLGVIPVGLEAIELNADGLGSSLTQFAQQVLRNALMHGLSHVFVNSNLLGGTNITQASIQGQRRLASFKLITGPNLLDIEPIDNPRTGNREVYSVRYRAFRIDRTIDFHPRRVEQIWYITANGRWELWEAPPSDYVAPTTADMPIGAIAQAMSQYASSSCGVSTDQYVSSLFGSGGSALGDMTYTMIAKGTHGYIGSLPLLTFYTGRTDWQIAKSPFQPVAELALAYWRSNSQQRSVLQVARSAIVFLKKVKDADAKRALSALTTLVSEDSSGDVKLLESSGRGVALGAEDLEALERRIDALTLRISQQRTGAVTAHEIVADDNKTKSNIQQWVANLAQLITDAYSIAGRLTGQPIGDPKVDIFNEFNITLTSATDVVEIRNWKLAALIDAQTALEEAQRRGFLADDADIEKILERVAEELPTDPGDPALVDPDGNPEATALPADAKRQTEGEGVAV